MCKYRGGPVWEHNSILSTWSNCLSELQIGHQTEPRNRYTDTEDRPDIVMFDLETGRNEELDISLAHTWSKDAVKKVAKEMALQLQQERNEKEQSVIKKDYRVDYVQISLQLCLSILVDGVWKQRSC